MEMELVNMKDAARLVGQSYMRLYMAVYHGKLNGVEICGKNFIRRSDISDIKRYFDHKDKAKSVVGC